MLNVWSIDIKNKPPTHFFERKVFAEAVNKYYVYANFKSCIHSLYGIVVNSYGTDIVERKGIAFNICKLKLLS
jgi:hypothetical protein